MCFFWVDPVWFSLCFRLGCLFPFSWWRNFRLFCPQICSQTFSLFSFWDLYNTNTSTLNVAPEVSETVLTSFHSFFHLEAVISTSLFSILLFDSSVSCSLLLSPSSVFLIFSYCILHLFHCSLRLSNLWEIGPSSHFVHPFFPKSFDYLYDHYPKDSSSPLHLVSSSGILYLSFI